MKNVRLISHRGNVNGPCSNDENSEDYITRALNLGYDVEVDIWYVNHDIFMGHDLPQYKTHLDFIMQDGLWLHCKNIEALFFCIERNIKNNYFFHDTDDAVLTSNLFLWTYPGKKVTNKSIAVMPEFAEGWDISECFGVCSDYVDKIKYGDLFL